MGMDILKRKMAAYGLKLKLSLSLANQLSLTYIDIGYLKTTGCNST